MNNSQASFKSLIKFHLLNEVSPSALSNALTNISILPEHLAFLTFCSYLINYAFRLLSFSFHPNVSFTRREIFVSFVLMHPKVLTTIDE